MLDLATGHDADEAAIAAARARTPSPLPPKKVTPPAIAPAHVEVVAPRQLTPAQREVAKAAGRANSAPSDAPASKASEPTAAPPATVKPAVEASPSPAQVSI